MGEDIYIHTYTHIYLNWIFIETQLGILILVLKIRKLKSKRLKKLMHSHAVLVNDKFSIKIEA